MTSRAHTIGLSMTITSFEILVKSFSPVGGGVGGGKVGNLRNKFEFREFSAEKSLREWARRAWNYTICPLQLGSDDHNFPKNMYIVGCNLKNATSENSIIIESGQV